MPTLHEYLARSVPKEKRDRIQAQVKAHSAGYIYFLCGCGDEREFSMAFRCFYCGEWYCETCARQHFHFSEYHGLDELLPGFLTRMQAELHGNAHKGSWRRWRPTPEELMSEMLHHVDGLRRILVDGEKVTDSSGRVKTAAELCADVANFAMKGFERFHDQ